MNTTPCASVTSTPSTRTLAITPAANIGSSAAATIVIAASAGIRNPASTGSYTLSLSTSKESAQTSNSYTIVQSAMGAPTITLGSHQPSVASTYTIDFSTGAGGALVAGSSTIIVDLPNATTVAASINPSDITVNGEFVTLNPTVNTSAMTIEFTTPANVSGGGLVSVVIASGITNPGMGDYFAWVHTSVETTQVASKHVYRHVGDVGLEPGRAHHREQPYKYAVKLRDIVHDEQRDAWHRPPRVLRRFPGQLQRLDRWNGDGDGQWGVHKPRGPDDGCHFEGRARAVGKCRQSVDGSQHRPHAATITNPALARADYTLNVFTSTDAASATTPTFLIKTNTSLSASITPSPTTVNTIASYALSMTVSADASLTAGVDVFWIGFPTGVVLPASISTNAVSVNGVDAYAVTIAGQYVKVTTPIALGPGSSVSIGISASAGIRNPGSATQQTWPVSCTTQPTPSPANYTLTPVSGVTAATVTPSPSTVNTIAQYMLDFTMGHTGFTYSTPNTNGITITFPDNTSIPTTIGSSAVTVIEGSKPAVSQTIGNVVTNPAARTVTVYVNENVAADSSMRLTINTAAGIINPSTPSTGYTLGLAATSNSSSTSNVYTVTNSQVSAATVTLSPDTKALNSQYTIGFSAGTGGALAAGTNSITVAFPAGTTVPSFIPANTVTVNGVLLGEAPTISGGTVTMTSPVNVANNGAVTVVFTLEAGVVNPATSSSGYTLKVNTSKEPAQVSSLAYSVSNGTDITNVSVSLSPSTKATASAYTINFRTSGDTPIGAGTTLVVVFPSSTTLPATFAAGNVMVGGTVASAATVSTGAHSITVTTGAGTNVPINTNTSVVFSTAGANKITNPANTGSNYTLSLKLGAGNAVISSRYAVHDDERVDAGHRDSGSLDCCCCCGVHNQCDDECRRRVLRRAM